MTLTAKVTRPVMVLMALSPLLLGVAGDQTESILDRLERKLLEKERQTLSFGENFKEKDGLPSSKFLYDEKAIEGQTTPDNDLAPLDNAITELESQVEFLANNVHAVKQKILQDAGIDNFIRLSTRLDDEKNMAFRSLSVTIDGHKVYEQNTAIGLWLPDSVVPLFQGPMQPGDHRLDFDATVVQKAQKALPLEEGQIHQVHETYAFTIPPGKVKKTWEIKLSAGDAAHTKADFEAGK